MNISSDTANAAGQRRELSTVRLPGRDGCYVLFAAAALAAKRAKTFQPASTTGS